MKILNFWNTDHVWGWLEQNPSSGDDAELSESAKRSEKELRVFGFGAIENFAFPRNDL